jgi:hypothetical protein
MNRCLALMFACFLTLMTVSSTCIADPSNWIRFTLEPTGGNDRIRASFRDESASNHSNSWSSWAVPGFAQQESIRFASP